MREIPATEFYSARTYEDTLKFVLSDRGLKVDSKSSFTLRCTITRAGDDKAPTLRARLAWHDADGVLWRDHFVTKPLGPQVRVDDQLGAVRAWLLDCPAPLIVTRTGDAGDMIPSRAFSLTPSP